MSDQVTDANRMTVICIYIRAAEELPRGFLISNNEEHRACARKNMVTNNDRKIWSKLHGYVLLHL